MKIHLHKPVGDLHTLFWDTAVSMDRSSVLVGFPEEADVIVISDPDLIIVIDEEDVDIVVVGVEHPPLLERPNVFFIRNHERIQWYLKHVPKRCQVRVNS